MSIQIRGAWNLAESDLGYRYVELFVFTANCMIYLRCLGLDWAATESLPGAVETETSRPTLIFYNRHVFRHAF
jgi:hypothetical protein